MKKLKMKITPELWSAKCVDTNGFHGALFVAAKSIVSNGESGFISPFFIVCFNWIYKRAPKREQSTWKKLRDSIRENNIKKEMIHGKEEKEKSIEKENSEEKSC